MTRGGTRSRCVSDWLGFLFYGAAACTTLAKMPAFGILLMPTLALELFAAISFLIREPARAAEGSGRARLSAYGGTLFLLVFLLVADAYYPYWVRPTELEAGRMAGVMLWMAGSVWAAYSVWYLRYAFSIEPEARRLMTGGPYETARHPVYLGYFAQYLGMALLFPTFQFGAALFVWLLLMVDRMRNEERVLARTFPEYEDYRRRVSALGF
jgi:protein-S-isoprenylcysteine O-methyltransferase Ste14